MVEFQDYLQFIKQFVPGGSFDEDKIQFLRDDFEDLKSFIYGFKNSACGEQTGLKDGRKQVEFKSILIEQIFYYNGLTYFKISENTGRVLEGKKERPFFDLDLVQVDD